MTDPNRVYGQFTLEIIEGLGLPNDPCYDIIRDRIIRAYGAGYDRGRKVQGRPKAVVQLEMNGDFVREWDSSVDASILTGINSTSISKCCLKRFGFISTGTKDGTRYKWEYAKNYYKPKEI